jgi:hypothetical protein
VAHPQRGRVTGALPEEPVEGFAEFGHLRASLGRCAGRTTRRMGSGSELRGGSGRTEGYKNR